jgi:purine-binding chemotaxis protein CheW
MSNLPPIDSRQSPTSQRRLRQCVGFQVGEQEYAFRIEQIQEIVNLGKLTRLPQVPSFLEGVANLRGSIIPVVNLRLLLGLERREADADTRTIVVNVGARIMGCVVDRVSQVMRIPEESILPAPETVTGGDASYVQGFARIDDRLIILLDIGQMLDPVRWQIAGTDGFRQGS